MIFEIIIVVISVLLICMGVFFLFLFWKLIKEKRAKRKVKEFIKALVIGVFGGVIGSFLTYTIKADISNLSPIMKLVHYSRHFVEFIGLIIMVIILYLYFLSKIEN